MKDQNRYNYVIQHADNCLILGQRLAEWCGHGPVLEQDIAMTNISLDLIGQARMWYQYAAEIQGEGKSEDEIVAFRDAWDYRNVLLVEQPNGDFAQTIFRQFLHDTFSVNFYEMLMNSNDEQLAAIAAKSHKEALYHVRWSGDWVIRLGDGTEESHSRMKAAIEELWSYAGELTKPNATEQKALEDGYGVDLAALKEKRDAQIREVLMEATLDFPQSTYTHEGGKDGTHTEHLGYILSDLQFLQRAYPGQEW
ncbi:MAG: 1,2-phenylacetyl-CoA epoxidase subunit PaaC [Ekhidna sp.]|uniref:1,2-phenylacetyl-CoA epoxidase subunit PaaC n=1 Tax=Ekhidna sp. TaxID=2608089 RepID=UPI0032EFE8D9